MTPHTRSPDPRDTGQVGGARTGSGVAGGGSGPINGGRTGPIGGVAPGLVARVQQRLAATGAAATDAARLRAAVAESLMEDGVVLPAANLSALVRSIGDELTGLGPLAPLLADPTVTDVLVNGPADVWVERGGTMERAAVRFASAAAVAALVQRVVAPSGSGWTSPVPGSTPASRVVSGSMRCCRRSPPTGRWSPSVPSPGGGSSSAT
jgi:pilus assembly protein CpaF